MKKLFYILIAFSLFATSCSNNDEEVDTTFTGPNDNHLIAGGWVRTGLQIKEVVTDNQEAVDAVFDQYKSGLIGEQLGFSLTGTYTSSGSFHEIASKYKLKDGVLILSKDNMVKITFEDDTFFLESNFTSGFQWHIKEAAYLSEYKNASITKVIIVEKFERVYRFD